MCVCLCVCISNFKKLSAQTPSLTLETRFPITSNFVLKLFAQGSLDDGSLGYTLERSVSEHSKLGLGLECGLIHGVSVKAKFVTMRQAYVVPVQLSEVLSPAAVIYGCALPLLLYASIHQLCILPWLRLKKRQEVMERRRKNAVVVERQRQQARAAVLLMQETVERKVESEERIGGMIIVQGWYGSLFSSEDSGSEKTDRETVVCSLSFLFYFMEPLIYWFLNFCNFDFTF